MRTTSPAELSKCNLTNIRIEAENGGLTMRKFVIAKPGKIKISK